ncbi:MAG: peptidoglycan DD-metalloendopeptidase family protein [Candidatus Falkowbacteria bacterium]|nr:peptidoglycan DD-metalloendopeptidase family protein [Candidatus Falkowbacteria bacterium]
MDALQAKQKAYAALIAQKQAERANLNNQLSILENSAAKLQLDIDGVNLEIDRNNLETKKIQLNLENTDRTIGQEKIHMANLLRLMYKQDQVSTLEILLLNDSLTEFLNQMKYVENTNSEINNSLDTLKENKAELELNQQALADKKKELVALQDQLQGKNDKLVAEKEDKVFIIDQTKSSEQAYQSLLMKAKREQDQAAAEILSLEKTVRDKLAASQKTRLDNSDATMSWPVTKNYVTTTFHDPDYPFRNILGDHPGIDIRAAQGSLISAAAAGYVARVKFDGTKSYAYIMIIHNDGLSTVYGHVSGVNVAADQYVERGQIIGRSGGMPGSVGSGGFTSGPHLHFEVRKNGLPVDPLEYLP